MYQNLSRDALELRLEKAEKIIKTIHARRVDRKKPEHREWVLSVIATICKKYVEEHRG